MSDDDLRISRRAAIGSAGAAMALATFGWGSAAHAASDTPPAPGSQGGVAREDTTDGIPPGTPSPIGSAPQSGVTYVYFGMYDFFPWDLSGTRSWDGGGVYSSTTLQALAQVPAGAVIYDMEWYFAAAGDATVGAYIGLAGQGYLYSLFGGTLAAGATTVRVAAPSTGNGPLPSGSELVLRSLGATARLQGVRVGFKNYPVGTTLLPAPVRVYSAPAKSRISAGVTRTHSLASVVPVGAVGALVKLTAFGTVKTGDLVLASGGVTPGKNSAVSWFGSNQKFGIVTPVSIPAARTVKVKCTGGKTQYAIDVVGYLA